MVLVTIPRASVVPRLDDAVAEIAATIAAGLTPVELIDLLSDLERVGRTISAVKVDATAAFSQQVRAAEAERGVPRSRRGARISPEIAAARRQAPTRAGGTSERRTPCPPTSRTP